MAQVEIIDISKIYPVGEQKITAVESVTLSIDKGEFLSIVGHSGSGKTTLLSIVGGIIRPSSGQVIHQGLDICSLDDKGLSRYRNEKIGFMFQFASLLPMLTAKENVLLPILFRVGDGNGSERKAEEYLELVGLSDKIDSYPSQLSGGQQRRVAIARALINEPEIILADEPTGDLDEETESEIMELFSRLNRERQVTFLFITHNLTLAGTAHRRLRMSQGRIEEL